MIINTYFRFWATLILASILTIHPCFINSINYFVCSLWFTSNSLVFADDRLSKSWRKYKSSEFLQLTFLPAFRINSVFMFFPLNLTARNFLPYPFFPEQSLHLILTPILHVLSESLLFSLFFAYFISLQPSLSYFPSCNSTSLPLSLFPFTFLLWIC